jgi:hypothetical protein
LKANANVQISIQNSLGLTLLAENKAVTNLLGELTLTLPDLPSGVYFIRVESSSGSVMAKFVKR